MRRQHPLERREAGPLGEGETRLPGGAQRDPLAAAPSADREARRGRRHRVGREGGVGAGAVAVGRRPQDVDARRGPGLELLVGDRRHPFGVARGVGEQARPLLGLPRDRARRWSRSEARLEARRLHVERHRTRVGAGRGHRRRALSEQGERHAHRRPEAGGLARGRHGHRRVGERAGHVDLRARDVVAAPGQRHVGGVRRPGRPGLVEGDRPRPLHFPLPLRARAEGRERPQRQDAEGEGPDSSRLPHEQPITRAT